MSREAEQSLPSDRPHRRQAHDIVKGMDSTGNVLYSGQTRLHKWHKRINLIAYPPPTSF